jgi:hypothetical protein
MALIFAPLVRLNDGKLPLSVGTGGFTPENYYLGMGVSPTGRVYAVLDGVIAHYSHGLPFDTDGRLVVSQTTPQRYDMSVPFALSGAISGGS